MSDMRDLRFMAEIYTRQNRLGELAELWKNPPQALKRVWEDDRVGLNIILVNAAQKAQWWVLLSAISEDFIRVELEMPSAKMKQICSVAFSIWNGFMKATNELYSPPE